MLLAIMVVLILALIALTATAPYYVTQAKRDREEQLIRRGKAYANAIKRYYKRFGRYPTSLTELQSTQNLRFIRKLYKDPMVPDGEWRIIHYGEAKYPPKGFGFNNIPGLTFPGGGSPGGPAGAQVPGGLTSIFGSSSSTSPQPGPGGQQQSSSNQPNTSGMTPADQISKPLGAGSTIGGGPVIGVASKDTAVGIHEVNERQKINEWEFFYDPRYDIATMMQVTPGAAGGAMPGPPGQQVSPFGQQPGGQQPGGFGQGPGGKR